MIFELASQFHICLPSLSYYLEGTFNQGKALVASWGLLVIVKFLRTFVSKSSKKAGKILRRVVSLVVQARVMAEMALSPHKCAAPTAQHDTGQWQCGHPHLKHLLTSPSSEVEWRGGTRQILTETAGVHFCFKI